jgi:predicted RNase H-like HicB family nuclease
MFGATVEQAGRSWFVQVPGLPGFHTQVETVERAEPAIRQVIALRREIPADSFDVTVTVVQATIPTDDE